MNDKVETITAAIKEQMNINDAWKSYRNDVLTDVPDDQINIFKQNFYSGAHVMSNFIKAASEITHQVKMLSYLFEPEELKEIESEIGKLVANNVELVDQFISSEIESINLRAETQTDGSIH